MGETDIGEREVRGRGRANKYNSKYNIKRLIIFITFLSLVLEGTRTSEEHQEGDREEERHDIAESRGI